MVVEVVVGDEGKILWKYGLNDYIENGRKNLGHAERTSAMQERVSS
jgi:hypothetical protein